MTNRKSLCLNMIVKNEMANLARCLSAVAPYIDCWVIGDTGSTDGTQDFIKDFFAARDLPGELHSFPFHNFEQARNAALDCAYASPLAYDYLLLDDADMELVVEDEHFRTRLEAPCYTLLQRSGVSYWNARIVRRDAGARYHGVTHEYLGVPGGTKPLHGVWYKDHASGSNRVDKFERDIRLLLDGLKQEPDSHRYWFYLAQSYRDAGQTEQAAEAYAKRAEMGGWDEEVWYARLQLARCQRKLGDEGAFVRDALAAFNQRPHRGEPLYDLARFYRERGMNDASVLFSEDGIGLGRPDGDTLFIEDFIYQTGFKEEYSIAANYARDPARKDRGFAACNWLALGREVPVKSRGLARSNLRFYAERADHMIPSFAAHAVGFAPPDGYHPTNPSVACLGEQIVLVQGAVNFTLTEAGEYRTPDGAAIHTRNFLLRLSAALDIESSIEILPPADLPAPAFPQVRGFEDARLFAWRDALWCCATVRELTPEGWCQQVLARVDASAQGSCRLADWRVLAPAGAIRHEKNWMPLVDSEQLLFIYGSDPTRLVDDGARTVAENTPAIAAEEFRGGTQAIEFDGGRLALVHEVLGGATDKNRIYHHRFVRFDAAGKMRGVSRPFFLRKKGVEFAAGLAWHPDGRRLLISYRVDDREAWIATVDAAEVRAVLEDVERLPWGAPAAQGRETGVEKNEFAVSELRETAASSSPEFRPFLTLLRAAREKETLARPDEEIISAYLEASALCPTRAEALHGAARYCRNKGLYQQGFECAARGLAIAYPNGMLTVEDWIYEYGLLDEFAVNAYWTARYAECVEACDRLLTEGKLPAEERDRVLKNRQFAIVKLADVRAAITTGESDGAGASVMSALHTGRSFDLFDTLLARRCVHANEIFDSVERLSGRAGFADARGAAEADLSSDQYTLDDIYRRLVERHGVPTDEADRLKRIELETESAALFPILEHCREVGPNDVIVSDMYLPAEWLLEIVRETCNLTPRRLYVSSNGKRHGTIWKTIQQTVKLTEHIGDNPITDVESSRAAGIPARLTTIARRNEFEHELANAGFAPLSNLIREARLTTWHDDPTFRRAQIAQVQINFPMLFLATLHLLKLSWDQGWDHILMSARDCYLWHRLYQRMRVLLADTPTATYFHTSRVVRAHPSPSYLAYFTEQGVGRRNVVVDLCGTGWSLSRLVERAPRPSVDIFLLHKLEMPNLLRDYERFGLLAGPIKVHAIVARRPNNYDQEVLERMNLAPDASVEDVQDTPSGFRPVLSSLNYPDELTDLIRIHHAAFDAACELLPTLTSSDIAPMLKRDIAPAFEMTYSRMADRLSEFEAFGPHKAHEERRARQALEAASAIESGKSVKLEEAAVLTNVESRASVVVNEAQ